MVISPLRAAFVFALAFAWSPTQTAGQETSAPQPIRAEYANPSDRYPNNIMESFSVASSWAFNRHLQSP